MYQNFVVMMGMTMGVWPLPCDDGHDHGGVPPDGHDHGGVPPPVQSMEVFAINI